MTRNAPPFLERSWRVLKVRRRPRRVSPRMPPASRRSIDHRPKRRRRAARTPLRARRQPTKGDRSTFGRRRPTKSSRSSHRRPLRRLHLVAHRSHRHSRARHGARTERSGSRGSKPRGPSPRNRKKAARFRARRSRDPKRHLRRGATVSRTAYWGAWPLDGGRTKKSSPTETSAKQPPLRFLLENPTYSPERGDRSKRRLGLWLASGAARDR